MNPERWRRIEEVYNSALEVEPGQRQSYLERACAGDEALCKEVEQLLASQPQIERFIESPAMQVAARGLAKEKGNVLSNDLIGRTIAQYRIAEKIGQGGMGEVFLAQDNSLRRKVALKFLPPEMQQDAQARARFLREARSAAALDHPYICHINEVGESEGKDFIVMEYVDGQMLMDKLRRRRLPLNQALQIAMEVAEALQAAHSKGIIHRDLKPSNIMIMKSGHAMVMDFGLAKQIIPSAGIESKEESVSTMTRSGMTLGTLAYMSPEQLRGEEVDARSDVFSFGLLLYEMVTGTHPFRGRSHIETMHAIINNPTPPLGTVPPRVEEILDKALEKDPKERYQSAADLAVDLRRSQKSGQATRNVPQRTRRTGWVWIAAAAVALAVGATGWFALRPAAPADDLLANAQFTRFTDFEGAETDAAISRDGKFVAFRSDRDGPVDTWVSQVGTGRFVNLTHGMQTSVLIRNMGFTPDGSEIWLSGVIGGTRLRLIPLTGGTARTFLTEHAMNAGWSPDGSRIVFHTYDAGDPMFVCDSTGANARQIFTLGPGGHNHFPTWSVDGQWIYFVSGMWNAREMDIWRIRPSDGTPERLTQLNSDVRYLAPLDSQTLLYVAPDQNGSGPWLWALDTEHKISRRISSGLDIYSSVESSADGHRLVVAVSNPTANLWSIPLQDLQMEERDVKPFNLPTVRAFAPRYGGTSLFYLSSRSGGDGLWRYENGQATEIWRGADGALLEPAAASFDGRRVAVILRKQGKRRLTILAAEGGDIRPLAETIDVSSAAGWSPDGKWIVAGGIDGKGPGLLKIPVDGGEPVRLVNGLASNPVWSPDGSVIVYTGPVVGISGPLLMIRPDGTPVEAPSIQVRAGGERYRFVPGRQELVYLPASPLLNEKFWMLDLATKKTRQLSNFGTRATRTFDISPDGKQLVFDRLRDNSDIVLIDLKR